MDLSRTRLVAGIAAAALPLAFLAGCGEDEPEPKFEEPTSESPSASESATPDEPVKPTPPAAMKGDDVAGAKAFAEYYFGLLDYAKFSGDTKRAKRLALPSCVACAAATEGIDQTHKAGGTYEGGEITVRRTRMSDLGEQGGVHTFRGLAWLHTTREVVRGSGSKERDGVYPASRVKVEFVSVRDADGWHVGEWNLL